MAILTLLKNSLKHENVVVTSFKEPVATAKVGQRCHRITPLFFLLRMNLPHLVPGSRIADQLDRTRKQWPLTAILTENSLDKSLIRLKVKCWSWNKNAQELSSRKS